MILNIFYSVKNILFIGHIRTVPRINRYFVILILIVCHHFIHLGSQLAEIGIIT